MIAKSLAALACAATLLFAASAGAQEAPLALSHPYAIHTLTGPNPSSRYVPGDVVRIGVFANHSEQPTTVTATQGAVSVDIPFYRGPIMDDLFDGNVPFEPNMAGAWMITAVRGTETASIATPEVPAIPMRLLDDLHIERRDGVPTLTWRWPDLSDALSLGLTPLVKILAMQDDNHDELLLSFGLRDHPIIVGAPGDAVAIAIPDELEVGLLYVFRVHVQFLDGAGNVVAQSITFVQALHPG